jgi:uncharacterized metal-binding protein YceD (DUF177 family)
MTADPPHPELCELVPVDRVGPGGLEVEVCADAAQCVALAARMAIPAVLDFVCRFRLSAAPGAMLLAEGLLRARVVRTCVVTLEAFETLTEERFRVRFVPAGRESDDDDPESDDEIPYTGGTVDLGEAAAEQLALALDPYPRKPDAVLPDAAGDPADPPFAALARLPRRG